MAERRYRWRVAIGTALILAGAGIWFLTPALLVAAIAPMAFVVYGALSASPAPASPSSVQLERTITPARTYPGGTAAVELLVSNDRDSQLLDVRVVDGVPDELAVVDGSPRAGLSLEPGETASIEYTLRARYGEFDFTAVTVRTHSVSASNSDTAELPADGDGRLSATLNPEEYPLGEQTTGITGELTTDRGGEGLEFHGIRSYQPEDPMNRINWRQYARERQLSTVDYRQQEAVEVLVLVDARESAQVARGETAPTGTELSVYVANEVIGGLLQNRNQVGAAVLGIDGTDLVTSDTGESALAWVSPGSDRQVRIQIGSLLDAAVKTVRPNAVGQQNHPDDAPPSSATSATTDESETVTEDADPLEIVRRIHQRTQILLVTPLCDEYPLELVHQLRSTGHTVNVYSPDVTARRTVGGQVVTAQRSLWLTELRRLGATVVDWTPGEPLAVAFNRSTGRETPTPTLVQP